MWLYLATYSVEDVEPLQIPPLSVTSATLLDPDVRLLRLYFCFALIFDPSLSSNKVNQLVLKSKGCSNVCI